MNEFGYLESRNKEVAALRSEGWTYPQLSKKFGRSIHRLRQVVKNEESRKRRPAFGTMETISVRTRQCVANEFGKSTDTVTIDDIKKLLATKDEHQLLCIPNFGRKSLREARRIVASTA